MKTLIVLVFKKRLEVLTPELNRMPLMLLTMLSVILTKNSFLMMIPNGLWLFQMLSHPAKDMILVFIWLVVNVSILTWVVILHVAK
jgi:hypothetical protein